MTFPNNSVIAASGWNKQNIYLSINYETNPIDFETQISLRR